MNMDVRSILTVVVFLSATPAFAADCVDDTPSADVSQVNRAPAVLGPATDEPVAYAPLSAENSKDTDQAIDSPSKDAF